MKIVLPCSCKKMSIIYLLYFIPNNHILYASGKNYTAMFLPKRDDKSLITTNYYLFNTLFIVQFSIHIVFHVIIHILCYLFGTQNNITFQLCSQLYFIYFSNFLYKHYFKLLLFIIGILNLLSGFFLKHDLYNIFFF